MAINKRIRKDGSVAWQVVVDDHSTGRRVRHTVGTFPTKKIAKQKERQSLDKLESGRFVERSRHTVADLVATWQEAYKNSVRASSWAQYEQSINLYIIPALGDIPLQKLNVSHITSAIDVWLGDGERKRFTAARSALHRLSTICKYGVKARMLAENPCESVPAPRDRSPKQRTIWTEEQTARFISVTADSEWPVLWHLLIETGMRRGEALGLHWRDVDWDKSEVRIVNTAVRAPVPGEKMMLQPYAKTDGSRRAILISSRLLEMLRLWHEDHHGLLVFDNGTDGEPLSASRVYHRLRHWCKRAGVPVVSIHELRHLAATRMMRAGVPLAVAQHRMGHTSSKMLLEIYQHADADSQRAAVTALEHLGAVTFAARHGEQGA